MSKRRDITGQRFGQLVALQRVGTHRGRSLWEFHCDCGNRTMIRSGDVICGRTKSCGCLRKKTAAVQAHKNATHGRVHTRLYTIWCGMKQRCSYQGGRSYGIYGGRGISVCDEWIESFEAFCAWAIENGYRDDLTLDRKDNDGPYSPENCRWSTMEEQQNNRRNNRIVSYRGKTQTLSQWAKQTGIQVETIAWRVNAGWPEEDLFIPVSLSNSKLRKERRKDVS